MCNHVHPIVFACFFHTGQLCLGSMVHLEFFLTTMCLVSSGFLAKLFLISFCIQNRLRGNHCLRSPSFCTVCTVCPLRKWRRWYEEAKREKAPSQPTCLDVSRSDHSAASKETASWRALRQRVSPNRCLKARHEAVSFEAAEWSERLTS